MKAMEKEDGREGMYSFIVPLIKSSHHQITIYKYSLIIYLMVIGLLYYRFKFEG